MVRTPARRWYVVAVLALTVTVSYGVLMYAFPVVLTAMQAELGWSLQTLTGGYAIGALAGGITAVPVGRWIDRGGPRAVMTGSAIAATMLVAAWSQMESRTDFYLVWIGLGACSAGLFYEPAFATVATWFERDRARALTIITVAGGLASTIFVPVTAALLEHFGWRGAVLCLAALLGTLTIAPHAVVLRPTPLHPRLCEYDLRHRRGSPRHALEAGLKASGRHPSWRRLSLAFFLSTTVNAAFALHLIPLLLARGHTMATASTALAGVGAMKLVGRILILPLASRISTRRATQAMFLIQAAGLVLLAVASSMASVAACVLLFGVGDGASTPARAELVTESYGARHFGTISGVLALILAAARAAGPIGASVAYGVGYGYSPPLALMALALFAAAWTLGREPRRLRPSRPSSVYSGKAGHVNPFRSRP
jgi:MFS family permease